MRKRHAPIIRFGANTRQMGAPRGIRTPATWFRRRKDRRTDQHRTKPASTIWQVIPPDLAAGRSVWYYPIHPFWRGDFASNLPKTCQKRACPLVAAQCVNPCRLPIRGPRHATLGARRVANRSLRAADGRWRPGCSAAGRRCCVEYYHDAGSTRRVSSQRRTGRSTTVGRRSNSGSTACWLTWTYA